MATNLVLNPGAEDGIALTDATTGATRTQDTTHAASGSASFHVTYAGTNVNEALVLYCDTPTATEGDQFRFRAAIRGGDSVDLVVRLWHTGFAKLQQAVVPCVLSGDFQDFEGVVVVPADFTIASVELLVVSQHDGTKAGECWVDDALFALMAPASRIFPVVKIGSPHIGPLRAGKD